jgi:SAM-dependent methyltransferase
VSGESTHREVLELEPLFTTTFDALPDPALFPDLPVAIWTEDFWRANELANLYTDLAVARIVKSGVQRGASDAHRRYVAAWLERKRSSSVFARRVDLVPSEELVRQFRDAILRGAPALSPTLELIDVAASGYAAFLRGEIEGQDILFGPETIPLWASYFDRENPLYHPTNVLAACAAREAMNSRTSLRVLEVGAGCGSGSETLVAQLGAAIASMTLTDISPNFLRKARERVEAASTDLDIDVQYRLLDLNRPVDSWKLEPSSCDLVFGVNVLHTVHDLLASLEGLRDVLVDGGHLVLGECIRPQSHRPVHPEFIFQLLDVFHSVKIDPDYRQQGGFLDAGSWRMVLDRAGFTDVFLVPDFERIAAEYSEYSVGAIVAKR